MVHYVFDIDGTLTPSRQPMDPEFFAWFDNWCSDKNVHFVTGSDYFKTAEQVSHNLCEKVNTVYNCAGSIVTKQGVITRTNEWDHPPALTQLMKNWLHGSKFKIRTGNHVEKRQGMVNFSIVGRNATLEQRKEYVEWDTANKERETIASVLNHYFDDIKCTVGGETGIDIHPIGWDKSQILKDFKESDTIHFYGDAMFHGGNDEPLAHALKKYQLGFSHQVKDWEDTWRMIKDVV